MLDFVKNHWVEILAIVGGIKIVASTIVNLTPTPKDDEIFAKVYGFIELLAGIWTSKAKG